MESKATACFIWPPRVLPQRAYVKDIKELWQYFRVVVLSLRSSGTFSNGTRIISSTVCLLRHQEAKCFLFILLKTTGFTRITRLLPRLLEDLQLLPSLLLQGSVYADAVFNSCPFTNHCLFSAHPRCKNLWCFSLLRNRCCCSVHCFALFVPFVLRHW